MDVSLDAARGSPSILLALRGLLWVELPRVGRSDGFAVIPVGLRGLRTLASYLTHACASPVGWKLWEVAVIVTLRMLARGRAVTE